MGITSGMLIVGTMLFGMLIESQTRHGGIMKVGTVRSMIGWYGVSG